MGVLARAGTRRFFSVRKSGSSSLLSESLPLSLLSLLLSLLPLLLFSELDESCESASSGMAGTWVGANLSTSTNDRLKVVSASRYFALVGSC